MNTYQILTRFRVHPEVIDLIRKAKFKFLCIATSDDFICLGASTGSTYVFDKSSGKLLRFFSNNVDAIVSLSFSNDGKIIAAAERSGVITCWEVDGTNYEFKICKEITELAGTTITAMCWSDNSCKLFVGNTNGTIIGFSIGFALQKSETIQKAGDPIVQMDSYQDRLVVSSTTKAVLCYLERSQKQQIGTKPRDGMFGSCFLKTNVNGDPVIYSARPGSRLWEVDFNGQVLATHQFKDSLRSPPTPIVACKQSELPESNSSWKMPQSFNFPMLHLLLNRYLVTWSNLGIYLIDPTVGSVVCWNDQIKDIIGISCSQKSVFILHKDSSLTELVLSSVRDCLIGLRKLEDWHQLAIISLRYKEEILKNVEQFLSIGFDDVLQRLQENKDENPTLIQDFQKLIELVEKCHIEVRMLVQEKLNAMKLSASDDSVHQSSDVTDDSGEDARSNTLSEGVSETSSKISLTRLAEVKENLVQKAANVMVSKVIKTGFMKKALRDALQLEGVIIDTKNMEQTHSVPTSPRTKRTTTIQRRQSDHLPKSEVATSSDPREKFIQRKTVSSPALSCNESEIEKVEDVLMKGGNGSSEPDGLVERKKTRKTKKKRKAKMVELKMADESVESRDGHSFSFHSSTNGIPEKISTAQTSGTMVNGTTRESKEQRPTPSDIPQKQHTKHEYRCGLDIELNFIELPPNTVDIVNKLVNTTYATRNNFRDAGILYNPKSFLEKLKVWSSCLYDVTKDFSDACFSLLDSDLKQQMSNTMLGYLDVQCNNLLFSQTHSAFSEVCNLGMLCFESNTFPARCSQLKRHEVALLNGQISLEELMSSAIQTMKRIVSKRDKTVTVNNKMEYMKTNEDDGNAKRIDSLGDIIDVKEILFDSKNASTIASAVEILSCSPDILHDATDVLIDKPSLCENYEVLEGETCDSCEIDKCRACFVLRYFPIINLVNIRTLLISSSKCRWRTWLAYFVISKYMHRTSQLTKLMESHSSDEMIAREVENTDLKCFLANMKSIYNRSSKLFFKVINYKDLENWEVVTLIYSGIISNRQQSQEECLQYFTETITHNLKLDTIFARCIVESAVTFQPDRKLLFCDTCNKARPGSNTVPWRWGGLLKAIIQNIVESLSRKYQPLINIISKLCLERGYWYGFINLCPNMINREVLILLCQLGDSNFFDTYIKKKKIELKEEDCNVMLAHFLDQSQSNERYCCKPLSDWTPTLTVERLIRITALHCGTRYTLNCLKEMSSFSWTVELRQIYTSLLRSAQVENQQEDIVSSLIEVASAKVWYGTRKVIPHEFQLLKEADFEGKDTSDIDLDNITSSDYIQDESDAVWGCSINISSGECPVCTLPLYLKASYPTASAGLIVFQCGHSFHKICVPENACLACYHDNFSTLL